MNNYQVQVGDHLRCCRRVEFIGHEVNDIVEVTGATLDYYRWFFGESYTLYQKESDYDSD